MPNWIQVQAWYDTESGRYYMGAQPPMNPQPQQQYYSSPQPQQQYYSSPQPQQQYYYPPQPQQQYYRNVPSNHVMLGGQGGLVRYYQPMYQQPVAYEYYHNSYGQPVSMRVYPNNYGYPAQIGAYTGETNWQAAFPQQRQQEVIQNANSGWNDNPTTQEVIQNANSGWNDNPTTQESAQLQNDRIEDAIARTGVTDQTMYFDTVNSGPTVEYEGPYNPAMELFGKSREEMIDEEFARIKSEPLTSGVNPLSDEQIMKNVTRKIDKKIEKQLKRVQRAEQSNDNQLTVAE